LASSSTAPNINRKGALTTPLTECIDSKQFHQQPKNGHIFIAGLLDLSSSN